MAPAVHESFIATQTPAQVVRLGFGTIRPPGRADRLSRAVVDGTIVERGSNRH
jgi:hypothetical protein